MAPRIIGADEARALKNGAQHGDWNVADKHGDPNEPFDVFDGEGVFVASGVWHDGNRALMLAAPDLAHTVVALSEIVDAVRLEHAARVAWLASLPPGSCTSPPTQTLLAAEERTRKLLLALNGEATASIATRDDVRDVALAELELTIKSLCDLAHAMAAKVSKVRS